MPERAFTRSQPYLLPPDLEQWVAANHPVRFVDAFVAALPVPVQVAVGLTERAAVDGAPRYAPAVLARVWIYGFLAGIHSSRALERACQDQIPLRWLSANQTPDHNTLWRWDAGHREAMRGLLRQSVQVAVASDLVDLALVAVDGTKLRANAAADRMLTEVELTELLGRTETAIAALEAQNEEGPDSGPPTLPASLGTATALQTRVRAALAAVSERGAATGKARSQSTPRANVTDPEARWMKSTRGIIPAYNAQLAVAATRSGSPGRLVVAATVATQPTDNHQLGPVLAESLALLGRRPERVVADRGYFSGEALSAASTLEVAVVVPEAADPTIDAPSHRQAFHYDATTDTVRCPEGAELRPIGHSWTTAGGATRRYGGIRQTCGACPQFGVCTTNRSAGRTVTLSSHDQVIQAQRRERQTPEAQAALARRKGLVEGMMGTLKRRLGPQVTTRGRAKVEAEWQSVALGHNLRTLARVWQAAEAMTAAAAA